MGLSPRTGTARFQFSRFRALATVAIHRDFRAMKIDERLQSG
jgi:hypothetical protein